MDPPQHRRQHIHRFDKSLGPEFEGAAESPAISRVEIAELQKQLQWVAWNYLNRISMRSHAFGYSVVDRIATNVMDNTQR
jgi:hypothetical protein